MYVEMDGKCKQCGAEMHLVLSLEDNLADDWDLIRCDSCGNRIDYRDAEIFDHLLDILCKRLEGNSTAEISKIIIHRHKIQPDYQEY